MIRAIKKAFDLMADDTVELSREKVTLKKKFHTMKIGEKNLK